MTENIIPDGGAVSGTAAPKKSRKKLWAAVGVGVLAVAVAGGGALTTLNTTISGNDFRALVPQSSDQPEGALLQISGAPIDHVFDSDTFNHQVRADWTLVNRGLQAASFDGRFTTLANIDAELADALVVQYGVVNADGEVTGWRDGGTVAQPRGYATATGIDSIPGESELPIVVRVLLEDPTLIATENEDEVGQMLRVVADFVVSYMDPLSRD